MYGRASRFVGLLLIVLAGSAAVYPAFARATSPYVAQYDQALANINPSYLETKDLYAWNVSYYLRSLTIMYEATGDPTYLETLARFIDRVLAQRDDVVGDNDYLGRLRPAWGTSRYSSDQSTHYVWAVHTGMITYPMARFVRIVYDDASLHAEWKERADRYLTAVQEAVQAHDEDFVVGPDTTTEGYYTFGEAGRLGIVSDGVLPLNQQNALGLTLLELHAITGSEEYLDKASRLAHFFYHRMYRMPNGSYIWPYRPDPTPLNGPINVPAGLFATTISRSGEDVSHAAINVDFIIQAYRHGLLFQEEDIEALVLSVLENIFTQNGHVYGHIGGTGSLDDSYALQIGRWLELGLFDQRVFTAIARYYEDRPAPLVVLAYLAWNDLHWRSLSE